MTAAYICRRYILDDEQLSDTFDLLDVDKDGRLSRVEIAALLRTIKVEPTRIELDFIFNEMDRDKSGKINKEEFVNYMRSPPIHRITMSELEQQFKQFDRDGDGSITSAELAQMLAETADLHDKQAITDMFEATDTNGDGRISFIEFVKMMKE
uniref:Calmodulin n=1 Tax=Panagrellus redivivus TaxID=6233 RepID=A0A7E4VSS0_PANRE